MQILLWHCKQTFLLFPVSTSAAVPLNAFQLRLAVGVPFSDDQCCIPVFNECAMACRQVAGRGRGQALSTLQQLQARLQNFLKDAAPDIQDLLPQAWLLGPKSTGPNLLMSG